MKLTTLILSLLVSSSVLAGEVIPRDQLPEAITAKAAKKEPKFPGVPSCPKGRLKTKPDEVRAWFTAHDDHKCADASAVYVCAAFGKLSVKCE